MTTPDRWRCCRHCDRTYLACQLIVHDGHAPCCAQCEHPPRDREDI